MTEIIREHNYLTGYRFVIAEYGVVGAGLGLLVACYLAVGRFPDAFVWLGIVVNCALIALRRAAGGLTPNPGTSALARHRRVVTADSRATWAAPRSTPWDTKVAMVMGLRDDRSCTKLS